MAFFVDNFTGVATTQLQSHTPDTGTSWTRLWGSTAALDWVLVTLGIAPEADTDDGVMYTADATYPGADYYVEFTGVAFAASATRPTYVMVRVQDQENMYAVRLAGTGTNCQLYKKVSGTWSTLGSAFAIPADGSVCKLEIIGNVLTFYDDGVSVATDNTGGDITAAGKAGIAAGGGAELVTALDDSNATTVFDTFSVVEIAATGNPWYAYRQQ